MFMKNRQVQICTLQHINDIVLGIIAEVPTDETSPRPFFIEYTRHLFADSKGLRCVMRSMNWKWTDPSPVYEKVVQLLFVWCSVYNFLKITTNLCIRFSPAVTQLTRAEYHVTLICCEILLPNCNRRNYFLHYPVSKIEL